MSGKNIYIKPFRELRKGNFKRFRSLPKQFKTKRLTAKAYKLILVFRMKHVNNSIRMQSAKHKVPPADVSRVLRTVGFHRQTSEYATSTPISNAQKRKPAFVMLIVFIADELY